MKKVIEIKPVSLPGSSEYLATSYPGPGFYFNTTTQNWILVYLVGASTCSISLGLGYVAPFPSTEFVESPPPEPTGICAADLLKAIAISQNPLLAKELLKCN